MDGVLRCSRYAFGPNRLHFCGPDANREIWDYVNAGFTDFGLQKLLTGFEVLFPYLKRIALSNGLIDPFDPRVVDAYWLGNSLLDAVDTHTLHEYYIDDLRLKDRVNLKTFRAFEEKLGKGMLPNHNYHILNVPKRMGHQETEAGLEYKDSCRISWGKVTAVDGPNLTVLREPIVAENGTMRFGDATSVQLVRRLEADYDIEMLKVGEYITMHWETPCEVVSESQVARLRAYTLKSMGIASTQCA